LFALLIILPKALRLLDVGVLRRFRSAAKENQVNSVDAIINAIARAKVDPGFRGSCTDGLRVAEVSGPKACDSGVDRSFRDLVGDRVSPFTKRASARELDIIMDRSLVCFHSAFREWPFECSL
jgi:hypothetical protein